MDVAVYLMLPLASAMTTSCLRFTKRKFENISKHFLVMPRHTGKSYIAQHLGGNSKVILVDTDEFALRFLNDEERKSLEASSNDKTLRAAIIKDVYNRVYSYIRSVCKKDSSMKALFLSSDLDWVQNVGKLESTYVCIPSSPFIEEMILDEEEKKELLNSRAYILHKLPEKAITIYNSYEELMTLVKLRFGIQHTL